MSIMYVEYKHLSATNPLLT